MLFGVNNELF
jgi:hypothetical protein